MTIIGNLTRDPELRTTPSGVSVCSFTVAVNRRRRQGEEDQADFFRVNAWRELGENCAKWLIKGRKVAVVGAVSVSTYTGHDGKTYASLDVLAQDVEFLSSGVQAENQHDAPQPAPKVDAQTGFQQVEMDTDDLPF